MAVLVPRQDLCESRIAEYDALSKVCWITTRGGCLGHVWDFISMFVVSKGIEYSLPYYNSQDPMSSTQTNPLLEIGGAT